MRIAVHGLWHLGCVTAACLAEAGHDVRGLDPDADRVRDLQQGRPPIEEPGLTDLLAAGVAAGCLSFTTDSADALRDVDVVWVTFDTPVDEFDVADVGAVRSALEAIAHDIPRGAWVLISSQVPVGFTAELESAWEHRGLRYAVSPENLRLGKAIQVFTEPERIIVGTRPGVDRSVLQDLLTPFCPRIEWMSVESAEMTKHAINAFLATSVTFINELARLCEAVGADAKEVERGLKSEGRIGHKAYLSPGVAFAGGTLARDLRYLLSYGRAFQVGTPFFEGVLAGNELHKDWVRQKVGDLVKSIAKPVVAVLGLTYKPGTNTLRRSSSVELCRWLADRGIRVQAHDPAIDELPADLAQQVTLKGTPLAALQQADVAVVATEWPAFRALKRSDVLAAMRQAVIVDPTRFLGAAFGDEGEPSLAYHTIGRQAA